MSEPNAYYSELESAYRDLYEAEVTRRNETLLRYYTYFGMMVSGVGALMRLLLRGGNLYEPFLVLFIYFCVLFALNRQLVKLCKGNTTLALYVAQAPAWIVSIMLGSVLDPNNRTVTLFLFVALLPVFMLDKPRRAMAYNLFWIAAFVVVAWLVKPFDIFLIDMSFLFMFTFASLTTSRLLLAERLNAVELYIESEKHARTDTVTGLKNRYALGLDHAHYLGREIVLGLTRIDDLPFFIDQFGHNVADQIMRYWAESVADSFGAKRCYKYTAQELLLTIPNGSPEAFESLMVHARESFLERMADELHIRPSSSVGYVFGTAVDDDDFEQMVNHADVRLHEARHAGRMQIRGASYDRERTALGGIPDPLGGNLQSDFVDSLTGLPNMQAFWVRAQSLIDTYVDPDNEIVLIYFDLENFSSYNEENGYQSGDDLLREVAIILRDSFNRRLVARFSDDHFVVMCYLDEYEEGLAQALNMTYDLHGRIDMPLKAGVYIYRDRSENISVACDRAKAACDSVKTRYDVFWRLYDDELRLADQRRAHILAHLDDAVLQDWLKVYYQPIVHIHNGEVAECEALVRWIDPVFGFMPPDVFIGELERAHLIHKVDLWVAEHVCADYHDRVSHGLTPLPVSINLSRLDFVLCDVEDELCQLTRHYGVPHEHLQVEVTESALSDDFDQLVAVTNSLRRQGFEIWLDDFGSDYSSLTTLKDFPCDVIKLDLMFLRSFESNERSRVIIQQAIELAKRLGARSLAEGVEEAKHLEFLKEAGCDYAQGYLISKPQPLEDLVREGLIEG